MCFKKYNIIGVLILFFHFNGLSQDTLKYIFTYEVPIDEERSLNFRDEIKQYSVNDSVFVIEGLFADLHPFVIEKSNIPSPFSDQFEFQFKIENNQWFMKHEADWKIFFNGKEDTFGSWRMGGVDVMIQWKKTNIVDLGDTVYMLTKERDSPFVKIQEKRGNQIVTIEYGFEIGDTYYPVYFTYSSGFIAIGSGAGLLIREDKEYLREYLEKKAYRER